jgi:hypothetical protein
MESDPFPRPLSSGLTLFVKLILPVCWVLSLSAASIMVSATAGLVYALPLVALVAIMLALFIRYSFPLKTVVAHHDHLVIGNFVREERVGYDRIKSIRVVKWVNTKPTVVTLRSPCGFGDTITFIPRGDGLFVFGRERAATAFLRERAGLS